MDWVSDTAALRSTPVGAQKWKRPLLPGEAIPASVSTREPPETNQVVVAEDQPGGVRFQGPLANNARSNSTNHACNWPHDNIMQIVRY